MSTTARIEILKESGEVVLTERFATELQAQNSFDQIASTRWPTTYKGLVINTTEYFTGGNIGRIRLIAENKHGEFTRRELFRNA
jgi:hypothetical protein